LKRAAEICTKMTNAFCSWPPAWELPFPPFASERPLSGTP